MTIMTMDTMMVTTVSTHQATPKIASTTTMNAGGIMVMNTHWTKRLS